MHAAQRNLALSATIIESWPLVGVRAGSALVSVDDCLLIIQDDALAVVWVTPGDGVHPLATPGDGVHPLATRTQVLSGHGSALGKAEKPDFEAALVLPDGAILVLGSGSKANRRQVARIDPASGLARMAQLDRLYDAVEHALADTPNLEGAVLVGEVVRLFHRGSGGAASAIIDVPLGAFEPAFGPAFGPDGDALILSLAYWNLGALDGPSGPVSLAFTDATPGPDGRIYWLAAAEDTRNAIDDGAIAGSAIGVFSGQHAWYAPLYEPDGQPTARKAEGIVFAPDPMGSGSSGYLVTDPDDATLPAELCRFELRGPW